MANKKPQQRRKEESERLRGERYQMKFIDRGFGGRIRGRKKARRSINYMFWV